MSSIQVVCDFVEVSEGNFWKSSIKLFPYVLFDRKCLRRNEAVMAVKKANLVINMIFQKKYICMSLLK